MVSICFVDECHHFLPIVRYGCESSEQLTGGSYVRPLLFVRYPFSVCLGSSTKAASEELSSWRDEATVSKGSFRVQLVVVCLPKCFQTVVYLRTRTEKHKCVGVFITLLQVFAGLSCLRVILRICNGLASVSIMWSRDLYWHRIDDRFMYIA